LRRQVPFALFSAHSFLSFLAAKASPSPQLSYRSSTFPNSMLPNTLAVINAELVWGHAYKNNLMLCQAIDFKVLFSSFSLQIVKS
jgi:hypothetical protein